MNLRSSRIVGAIALAVTLASVSAMAQGQVVPAAASPLDQPLAWLQDAKRNYGAVKEYTCILVSQEQVKGKLEEQNIIEFKQKTEPFSIAMRWLAPNKSKGQQVLFVKGKNNDKMKVKSEQLGGGKLLGWMNIDPKDPRVTQHSRHTILEAGIGNMIDTAIRSWTIERGLGKTDVKISQFKFDDRPCYCIELTRSEKRPDVHCGRTVMYLEKESKLPMRVENYDHPRPGGTPGGDLLEVFSYTSLRFNVGLKDADFEAK